MGLSVALSNALSRHEGRAERARRAVAQRRQFRHARLSPAVAQRHRHAGRQLDLCPQGEVTRAFNQTLQKHYTQSYVGLRLRRASGRACSTGCRSLFGKPGDAGSLDTAFAEFQTVARRARDQSRQLRDPGRGGRRTPRTWRRRSTTSATRCRRCGGKRRASWRPTSTSSTSSSRSLEKINGRLDDQSIEASSRASADGSARPPGRRRWPSRIDVRVDYRSDGTVALMTRSGVGMLDERASIFEFQSAGVISATAQWSSDECRKRGRQAHPDARPPASRSIWCSRACSNPARWRV